MRNTHFIDEYWYSITWKVEELWKLELPTESFDIQLLLWHLDIPLWSFGDIGYQISPIQVINDPDLYSLEYARVQKADLNYPIEIIFHKNRWMILDGVHRLLKAYIQKRSEIQVRIVPIEAVQVIN